MQVFLETDRLILRRFTDADVDNLVELDSDLEVMRFVNGGIPTPREVIARDILPRFLSYYERFDGYGFWATIEKSTGDFLGWFHFRPPDFTKPDDVELGYRLRKAAWGKGYGTEGARALIRKGFTALGTQRVFASTYQDNISSRRVMEKAGLTLVRTYRITPEEIASHSAGQIVAADVWDGYDVEYALTKEEWDRQEAARHGSDDHRA